MKYAFQGQTYVFSTSCLDVLSSNRQRTFLAKEIGGQLFARFEEGAIVVEVATVTSGRSRRTRFGFWPDREAERQDIARLFKDGLHYIGDWHSHPEPCPSPSGTDLGKMRDIFNQSEHQLHAMLMVIVGQTTFPNGLFVGAVTASAVESLHPVA
ncbi:Mov34/MPN/PAD-1 family protein [Hydrogenophaga sp.]|uniref:Mov34/MPN/PAD-1 family protein n=1 Tax=Hydrogenophaga sp. TaxID=1904254 RepID=UPI00391BB1A4